MNLDNLRNLELEQYVLGGLLDREGYLIANDFKVSDKDFYDTKHQIIFNAIKRVFNSESKLDILAVADNLKNSNELQKVGGVTYLTELMSSCLSINNLDTHIPRLKDYTKKRDLYELGKFLINNLDKPSEELQIKSSELILNNLEEESKVDTRESQGDDFLKYIEEVGKGETTIIKTYLTALDRIIGGFYQGNLVTIFSFSNVGKTTFMLQLALNNIRMNKKALVFSLEMSPNEIRGRMITNLTNIPYQRLMYEEEKTAEEYEKILKANDELSKGLIVSNEDNLNNMMAKIQYEVLKNDTDIIFIDYIDLITLDSDRGEEYKKNIVVTRALKRLALKLKKPIVILAQCKQEVASKMSNPSLSINEKIAVNDVGGGASIFRDSDIVLGLYRNTELDNKEVRREMGDKIDYNSPNADKNPEVINILVKKTRASGKGMTACRYEADKFRVSNFR